MGYSAVFRATKYTHHNALCHPTLRYITLHYSILHYTTLYYHTILYNAELQNIEANHNTLIWANALHISVLYHVNNLYYATLHSPILRYAIPYCTILYYTILYYTIPYYPILYHPILYYSKPKYHTIPRYTTLYYTILYYTIHYSHTTLHSRLPHAGTQTPGRRRGADGAAGRAGTRRPCGVWVHRAAAPSVRASRSGQRESVALYSAAVYSTGERYGSAVWSGRGV